MNIKYYTGLFLSMPLVPLMYFDSRRLRKSVPKLPEASGTTGSVGQPGQKKLRLVTIGESTIAGVGVNTHEEGFTGTLAKELSTLANLSIDWSVFAKSGLSVRRVIDEILPTINISEADLLVIGIGANDAFEANRLSRWIEQVEELILALQTKFGDVPMAFTNMPPIKEFPAFSRLLKMTIGNLMEIMGEELEKVVGKFDCVFFNSELLRISSFEERLDVNVDHDDFFSDGVHPSRLTYQLWAKDFADYLHRNLSF